MSKIFIVGFMGAGKSNFGKKLANYLGYSFIDTDTYIEQKWNTSINEIFKTKGENKFREIEKHTLQNIIANNDQVVISTGGGMGADIGNMELMKLHGNVVYLELEEKIIISRLKSAKKKRPLIKDLSEEELKTFVKNLLNSRKPVYEKSNLILNALNLKSLNNVSLADIANKIC